jgi:hypothetical protein
MKIKVSEATNIQLNWMVAKCLYPHGGDEWLLCISAQEHPNTNWAQGGPIIEQLIADGWAISKADFNLGIRLFRLQNGLAEVHRGPTPLIAAMRCFIVSCLGNEVEVPEELA